MIKITRGNGFRWSIHFSDEDLFKKVLHKIHPRIRKTKHKKFCKECGRTYKGLALHQRRAHGLTIKKL